jgi:hypothetical protein
MLTVSKNAPRAMISRTSAWKKASSAAHVNPPSPPADPSSDGLPLTVSTGIGIGRQEPQPVQLDPVTGVQKRSRAVPATARARRLWASGRAQEPLHLCGRGQEAEEGQRQSMPARFRCRREAKFSHLAGIPNLGA